MPESLLIRRWPFVPIAFLLIGGIVCARHTADAFLIGGALLACAAVLLFVPKARLLATAVTIFCAGIALYSARYRIASQDDLRALLSAEPELVNVRGRIVETPSARDFYSGTNAVAYTYSNIELTEILRNKRWHSARGKVASRTRGELTADFVEGRAVEVTGVIELPPRAVAPGMFDYRAYLRNTRTFYQLKSDSTNDWQLLSFEPVPITERFRRWAQRHLQRGLPADENVELILAMTLGFRSSLSGEVGELFMHTGTMHIFAVSGLHVACIAGFILFSFRWVFGMSREWAGAITVPLIWFYTLATGWQSSAIRAALMFTVIIAGRMLKRPSDLLNSTAAAAVLILLFQPEQLFQAGFQLSFVVVASLAILLPPIQAIRPAFPKSDPLLPRSLWPRWRLWTEPLFRSVGSMVAVSVAAWIGSMPLTAFYFNIVTISSFLANLVAVPLSSVSLAATVFSILLPPLGPFFNFVAWAFMSHTTAFTRFCAQLPYGYFYVPKPNLLFFVFYFATVLVILVPALRRGSRGFIAVPIVAMLASAWLVSVFAGRPLATVTVLPCAGTPAFAQAAREPTLLIDTSSERDSDYVTKRFLHAQGLGSIDQLLLSHGDAQNVGGFKTIWERFEPRTVITSPARSRSPFYREALRLLQESPGRWRKVSAGDQAGGWTVLHPPDGRGLPRADDNCLVLKRTIGGWTLLHLSDLGAAGQKQLIESAADLRADIVIAGMPEQNEPLQDDLLKAISPRLIVLGTSRYPHYAEGTPELRRRLEASGAAVLYTTETDAVTIRIWRERCEISGMNGAKIELAASTPANRND